MTVYSKTAKGANEIIKRTHKLDPKLRRLLILVDGVRSNFELASMFSNEPVDIELRELATYGFIETASADEANSSATASAPNKEYQQNLHDLDFLPDDRPKDAFPKAKNFIINTLIHFHGQYGKLSLMLEVEKCHTHNELRKLYPDWLRCMEESKAAAKQLKKLNKQLFAVL